jgi:hypothetical protein
MQLAQTSATSLPSPNIRSACASVRTTCSGECLFLVVIVIEPSCPHRGRQDSHLTWTNQPGSGHGDDPADEVVERRVVTVLGDDRFEVGRTGDLEVVERIAARWARSASSSPLTVTSPVSTAQATIAPQETKRVDSIVRARYGLA